MRTEGIKHQWIDFAARSPSPLRSFLREVKMPRSSQLQSHARREQFMLVLLLAFAPCFSSNFGSEKFFPLSDLQYETHARI